MLVQQRQFTTSLASFAFSSVSISPCNPLHRCPCSSAHLSTRQTATTAPEAFAFVGILWPVGTAGILEIPFASFDPCG